MSQRAEGDPEVPIKYAPAGYGFITSADGESVLVPKVVDRDFDADVPDPTDRKPVNSDLSRARAVEMAALRHLSGFDIRSLRTIATEIGTTVGTLSKRRLAFAKRLGMRATLKSEEHRAKLRKTTTAARAQRKAAVGTTTAASAKPENN